MAAHLPPFAAIVVAAGKGERAGQSVPKQFATWRGKPLLRHSVERLVAAGADPLIVVHPSGAERDAREACGNIAASFVEGGDSRQQSVRNGLKALSTDDPAYVMVHDAARPLVPRAVIERLLSALADHSGAIPVLPVIDSIALANGETMAGTANRDTLRRVQTPQAFRYADILAAHRDWVAPADAGDDAQVLAANGGTVALVVGDEALKKVTFAGDFEMTAIPVRVGTGFDVHTFGPGAFVTLCGIEVPHTHGLVGHSDADAGLHAITDALLGAIAKGDIGDHFPPSDPQWKGASSDRFLAHAVGLVEAAGYRVGNVDLTLICEAPKIGPHREAMRSRIADIMGVDIVQVSVKATTTEKLGFTGRGEGIAAQASATVLAQQE